MSDWCDTHSIEEQLQLESEIVKVINECNEALLCVGRELTKEEILNGIKDRV